MIQMQQIIHILINDSSKLQLLVIHETKYKICHNMQGQRKQYGIKHYVSGIIHSDMDDTLPSVATSLSMADNNY